MSGAQTVEAIRTLVMTDVEDSVLLILADGRVIEVCGDGEVMIREADGVRSVSL